MNDRVGGAETRRIFLVCFVVEMIPSSVFLPCVVQDEVRAQKVEKTNRTLEEVNNSVKLLSEMLNHFSPEVSTDGDKEIIRVGPHVNSVHFKFLFAFHWLTKLKIPPPPTQTSVKPCQL